MKLLITVPRDRRYRIFDRDALDALSDRFDVGVNDYNRSFKDSELFEKIRDVDSVIVGWDVSLDRNVLSIAKKLKLIGKIGSGVGNIDMDFAYKMKIDVVNTAPAYANAVAEYTLALILDSFRNISLSNHVMKMPLFQKLYCRLFNPNISIGSFQGVELREKTVGLVGFGHIARQLAELLRPFDCRILAYDPYAKVRTENVIFSSLDDLLSNSDVMSIHAPLNEETYHMIGKKELELMKKGALIVNTGRADIIDTDVFYRYLEAGKFRAALDVFSVEPLPYRSILRKLSNVILTPHQAGSSLEAERRHGEIIVREFDRYCSGKSLNHRVTANVLKRMTDR